MRPALYPILFPPQRKTFTQDGSAFIGTNRVYGRFDSTTNAAQYRFMSASAGGRFIFVGTGANFLLSAGGAQPFRIRLDGSKFYQPLLAGGRLPIATNLPDGPHLVEYYADQAYTPSNVRFPTVGNGNAIEVFGSNPQLLDDANWGVSISLLAGTSGTECLLPGTDTSTIGSDGIGAPFAVCSGSDSFRFRATVEKNRPIWVWMRGNPPPFIVLEVDGANSRTFISMPSLSTIGPNLSGGFPVQIGIGDGTSHIYTAVFSRAVTADFIALGGTTSSFSTSALPAAKYIVGLGDSLTNAQACDGDNNQMHSYLYKAAKLIEIATGTHIDIANRGVDGRTTGVAFTQIATDTGTLRKTPDLFTIWLGTNDGATLDSSSYTSILDYLNTNFPGAAVICITCPVLAQAFATKNTAITAAVAARSNPLQSVTIWDITSVMPSSYTGCNGTPALHPSGLPDTDIASGHNQIANAIQSTIRTALGL